MFPEPVTPPAPPMMTESLPPALEGEVPPASRDKVAALGAWQRSKQETAVLVLRALSLLLVGAAGYMLWAVWAPLVLACWSAALARPLHRRLSKYVGGRERAAGVVSVALILSICAPIVLLGLSLAGSAFQLLHQLLGSAGLGAALDTLLSTSGAAEAVTEGDPQRIVAMLKAQGTGAFDVATSAFGAATHISVQLLVFVVTFYTFMVDGPRGYRWLSSYAPIPRDHFDRLANAFMETGRGLIVSFGLTAIAQGMVAAMGFLIAGVPKALALGVLTGFASFVPMVGTGLVTVPVTWAMFLAKDNTAAVICLVTMMLTACVDNPMRVILSRVAQLHLPGYVVFISMLGGAMVFGAGGLIAGPLLVRLSVETLQLWKEARTAHAVSTRQ